MPPILSMSTWGCMRAADEGRDSIPELTWVADEGQLWLSSVTMQGTGTDQSLAIDGFSQVHAESAPQPMRSCINPQSRASQLECVHAMKLGSMMRWICLLRESWTQSLSASRPHASRSGLVPCLAVFLPLSHSFMFAC